MTLRAFKSTSFFLAVLLVTAHLAGCGGVDDRKAAYLKRGQELVEQGDYEKARLEFRNVLQIDPKDLHAHFALAKVLEKLENWQAALVEYQRVLRLDEQHVGAILGLGKLFLVGGNRPRAAELAEKALLLAPQEAEALVLRGSLRADSGDIAGARADAEAALRAHPAQPNAIALLAGLDANADQLDAAIALLEDGVAKNPQHDGLATMLARGYASAGRTEEAIVGFQSVVERNPARLDYTIGFASYLVSLNRPGEAERVLREAVVREPGNLQFKAALVDMVARQRGIRAAAADLVQMMAQDPQDHRLRLMLAQLYETGGDIETAVRTYRETFERDVDGSSGLTARNRLARILIRQDRFDEAATQLAAVLERNPGDRDALVTRGTMALLRNDPGAAIVDFRTALRHDPTLTAVRRLRARAHLMNNEPEQAREDLQRVIEVDPLDAQSRLELVQLIDRAGDRSASGQAARSRTLDEAHAILEKRLAEQPDKAETLIMMGTVALARGDTSSAIAEASKALKVSAGSIVARQLLSRALLAANEPAAARRELEAAVAAAPQDMAVRLELAGLLERSGDLDASMVQLDAVLAIAPNNLAALETATRVRLARGDIAAAVESAQQLKMLAPTNPVGYYLSGLVLQERGELEESVAEFQQALERSPNAVAPRTALARSYLAQNRLDEALKLLQTVSAQSPDDVAALSLLGEALLKAGRNQEAEDTFRRVMALDPRWAVPHRNLGLSLLARGDPAGAAQAFGEALQRAPGDVGLAFELAGTYERMGRYELAIAQYESLLARQPDLPAAANNLAMLLVTYRDDPQSLASALALVEPLAASTELPYLDTVAWVRLKDGEVDKALVLLERIVGAAPDEPVFRFHLGMANLANKDRVAAEENLAHALDSGIEFQGIDVARSTLARIRGG